jgi:hypothetical protein
MLTTLRRHLTYANVAASLALFLALGGGAYAITVPRNTIGTNQIKTGGVKNADIARNAVTALKVKNNVLTGSDILESRLGKVPSATAADSATAAGTATTATTATNATQLGGKAAGSYISNIVIRRKDLNALADTNTVGGAGDGGTNDGTVQCAAGERAIGGGMRIGAAGVDQALSSSRPVDAGGIPADGSTAPTGWRAVASDSGGVAGNNPTDVQVFVICAS